MTLKSVAVHQPNLLPWPGFFNKIARADYFVLLDDVQYPRGRSWVNRSLILRNQSPKWMTLPVSKSSREFIQINRVQLAQGVIWRDFLYKELKLAYEEFPHFNLISDILIESIPKFENNLFKINGYLLILISEQLGIDSKKISLSSSLCVRSKGTQRLVDIINEIGGQIYLCGSGSSDYLNEHQFTSAGLSIVYQNYSQKPYRQFKQTDFVPGLSIIDLLMNVGLEEARSYVSS